MPAKRQSRQAKSSFLSKKRAGVENSQTKLIRDIASMSERAEKTRITTFGSQTSFYRV